MKQQVDLYNPENFQAKKATIMVNKFNLLTFFIFLFIIALHSSGAFAKCYIPNTHAYDQQYKKIAKYNRRAEAKVEIALKLLDASQSAIEVLRAYSPGLSLIAGGLPDPCPRGFRVEWTGWIWNWTTGRRLPIDPIAWVTRLPACALNLNCRFARFAPYSGERLDRYKIKECYKLGVFTKNRLEGGTYFCSYGEFSSIIDDSPEAQAKNDAINRREKRLQARAFHKALRECRKIAIYLKNNLGGESIRNNCDAIRN